MKSIFTTTSCQRQFWSNQADRCQHDGYALLQRGLRQSEGRRKTRMTLSMPWCAPNRDLLVLKWRRYQHIWLQLTLTNQLSPPWQFYAKWRALRYWEIYAEIQEKTLRKRRKGLRRKQWKQRAKPMNLGPFTPLPVGDNFFFLKPILRAFWRIVAHSKLHARHLSNCSLWTHKCINTKNYWK